jgi:NAD(P)-dependent dehydrogenase (short-subunit alcohol dehydrogenase family)
VETCLIDKEHCRRKADEEKMELELAGTRVLVTAGAAGIGREIAAAFRREGAKVHICDLQREALDTIVAEDPGITASLCDVSNRAAVDRLFAEASAAMGGLDCLVNNAGIAGPTGRVDQLAPDEWDRTLAVNITGQFNCARLAVPLLLQSVNPSIINVSSAAGRLGFRLRTPYAASKWATIGFTKSLSMELGEFGIRVNAILPGIVEGERQDRILAAKAAAQNRSLDEMRDLALAQASIKEMITPRQLADTVVFLASPLSRTTSGQAISVCGDLQALS